MAASPKPVQLYDARGNLLPYGGGRGFGMGGGSNRMIGPAQPTRDRKWIPLLNDDFHRNLTTYGRTILASLGKHIYFASGAVRGAVEDLCTSAAGSFMFESRSTSPEWRKAAETRLYVHDRNCDVAGPPNTMRSYRKLLTRALYTDGDMGTVYVRGNDGQPYLQVIPSHRICYDKDIVEGGPYDGARVIDGVVVDSLNRAIAYCVMVGDGSPGKPQYQFIAAMHMALHFRPIFPGQVRGVSELGLVGWDVQDVEESRRWELLAQKAGAGRVFQEWTEDGEPPNADYVSGPGAGDSTAGTPSGLWRETIDGGLNTYFKANSGARLEAVSFDRPSANQQAFVAQTWREALAGCRLSIDFNLNLANIGQGSLRVLIDKINLNHADLQAEVIEPASRRFDFVRLGTFIDNGELPLVNDWWNYEYQRGERLTADKRYDSAVNAEQLRIGVKTRSRATMELGESLSDVRAIRLQEVDELFASADKLAKKWKVPLGIVLNRLESDQTEAAVMSTYVAQTAGADDDPTDKDKDAAPANGGGKQ